MPDFQEPSGEAMRQQQELMHDYEAMMLRGMQAFHGVDPARQSAETSVSFSAHRTQHWEVYGRQGGYCRVDGCSWLTFPMVFFQRNRDRALIKFTVRLDQLREANRWSLRIEGDDIIFGEVLECRQMQDGIDVTLLLHPEEMEMRARAGDSVRYSLTVPTIRYRRRDGDAYRVQLERAGLLPDRLEALQELMQEQSVSMPTADDQRVSAQEWHYQRMERAGVFEELRQERSQPPIKQPAICKGCRHLHGQYHGGTLLVCGVHPYGNGEDCSDFEGF